MLLLYIYMILRLNTYNLQRVNIAYILHATNTAKINDFQDDIVVKHLL